MPGQLFLANPRQVLVGVQQQHPHNPRDTFLKALGAIHAIHNQETVCLLWSSVVLA